MIVNLPSNDQDHDFSADEQIENFDLVVAATRAAEQDVQLWITTTQPRNFDDLLDRQALEAMATTITERYEHVLDFWTGFADADLRILPDLDCGDGIHLNDAAHRILAERATATLDDNGRLGAAP